MNYEGNYNLNKVTGLWKHTDSNGNTYFKGNISMGCSVLIIPQGGKKEENRYIPDYILCFGPNEEEQRISDEQWDQDEKRSYEKRWFREDMIEQYNLENVDIDEKVGF